MMESLQNLDCDWESELCDAVERHPRHSFSGEFVFGEVEPFDFSPLGVMLEYHHHQRLQQHNYVPHPSMIPRLDAQRDKMYGILFTYDVLDSFTVRSLMQLLFYCGYQKTFTPVFRAFFPPEALVVSARR